MGIRRDQDGVWARKSPRAKGLLSTTLSVGFVKGKIKDPSSMLVAKDNKCRTRPVQLGTGTKAGVRAR